MFKIEFKILINNVKTLKNISLAEFEDEYGGDIGGLLLLNFNGNQFGYIKEDLPSGMGDMFEEWLITWFNFLYEIIKKLAINQYNYVALKYIENNSTWLEFKIINKGILNVSLINVEPVLGPSNVIVTTPFDKYTYGKWKNVEISLNEFVDEVIDKTKQFISSVTTINPLLLHSASLQKLIQYIRDYELFLQTNGKNSV